MTESHAPDADITLCGIEVWGNLTLRGTGTLNPSKEIVNVFCFENEEENNNLYSFEEDIPVGIYPDFSINIHELLK